MVSLFNSILDKLKLVFSRKKISTQEQNIKIKGVKNSKVFAKNVQRGKWNNDTPNKKRG